VICGLDSAGKTTMVSFLQNGTFIEHTPTMGKQETRIRVQGVNINLIDMGGQKDFRPIWLGEMQDAECVIFMVDAHAQDRFKEAKDELWKLASIMKKKPLFVLANKYDLEPVASIGDIMDEFDLAKLASFEVLPISCKTGYGIVNAFSKIYLKLTGKLLSKRISPRALTIFDKGGIPLTTKEGELTDIDLLRGGLFSAITSFAKESFNSELNQLKLDGLLIIFKRTRHLMGSIIIDDSESIDPTEAELRLQELLEHLENMCPELEVNQTNSEKIDFLTQQFATNILS
jgi:small GTP-binding protein